MGGCDVYTDEQKRQLTTLIDKYRKVLGLRNWTFEVDWDEPAQEGAGLDVATLPHRSRARIRIGVFFDDDITDAERENMVAHELVHCLLSPIYEVASGVCRDLSPQAADIYDRELRASEERVADALATALAPIGDKF